MRFLLCILSVSAVLCGCSPGREEYSAALEAEWNAERGNLADRAAYYEKFAAQFDSSAALSERISNDLGTDTGIAQRHRGVADQSRQEAEDARYLSKATFVKLKELHCARASSLPGENCEVTFLVKGPDGKEEERLGAYRFDQRNGALAVVGSVEPS